MRSGARASLAVALVLGATAFAFPGAKTSGAHTPPDWRESPS